MAHLDLTTDEYYEYKTLQTIAQGCASVVSRTNNEETREKEDHAIKVLIEFEKTHGIVW